jgi:hypothetical protein
MDENATPITPRCGMNFSQDARGFVKLDLTVESPTTEESAAEARKAIDEYRSIVREKGLRMLEAPRVE